LFSFIQAMQSGDLSALMHVMASDVTMISDSGGKAPAATQTLAGPERVARFLLGLPRLAERANIAWSVELAPLNGREALVLREAGRVTAVYTFEIGDGAIHAIYAMRNPDKLARIR
jgi:RNA polymerase sigma-70 factor (ECF subfamily)